MVENLWEIEGEFFATSEAALEYLDRWNYTTTERVYRCKRRTMLYDGDVDQWAGWLVEFLGEHFQEHEEYCYDYGGPEAGVATDSVTDAARDFLRIFDREVMDWSDAAWINTGHFLIAADFIKYYQKEK